MTIIGNFDWTRGPCASRVSLELNLPELNPRKDGLSTPVDGDIDASTERDEKDHLKPAGLE
jgi:hypothetical protein